MEGKQKIHCTVESCKYNEDNFCDLDELEISCICDKDVCEENEETICKSFKKNDDDKTEELEYEILEEEEEQDDDGEYIEEDI